MRSRLLSTCLVLVSAILLWSGVCVAQDNLRLYVGNSRGDDVDVIDMGSLKVIADIKAGERVHGVCLEPTGRWLFLTVESDHTLRIVNTTTLKTVAVVKLSGKPNECAVTPNGEYVVVPIRDGNSVQIVDAPEHKVVASLPIKEPHNALNTGSNRYTYVSSMGSDEIDVIDFDRMQFSEHIPVGGRPRPYVVSRDGRTMYVALANLQGFSIVDLPSKTVLAKVTIPSVHRKLHPWKFETQDTVTHGLALTPDGKELWVTSLLDNCLYIYDLRSKRVVGKVPTGIGPNWVVITPDGKYVCVSSTDTDTVSIIDAPARREVARIKVGEVPKRLALAPSPYTKAKAASTSHKAGLKRLHGARS
jgi:YVTN family beta-propeller protein